MRDELRQAFILRDDWGSYSRTTQATTRLALTVIGTDTNQWRADTITLEVSTDIDREAEAMQGRASRDESLASSEDGVLGERTQLDFVVIDGDVLVAEDTDFRNVRDNLDTFDDFQLRQLIAFEPGTGTEVPVDILENATAVFDLGVRRDSRRRDIQSYEVQLDVLESLPLIDLDLDTFLNDFNGVVELGALTEAVIEGSSLRLLVSVDTDTERVTETTLVMAIGAEIQGEDVVAVDDGSGRFSLELSREVRNAYFNINDVFAIEAP